jgi:hypothetical protein
MQTRAVRLVRGSGKRTKSVWEIQCPVCETDREFSTDHVPTNYTKAIARGIAGSLTNPGKFWPNLLTASHAIDVLGCSECRHYMVICANCKKAFSSDANATTYECPTCHTINA